MILLWPRGWSDGSSQGTRYRPVVTACLTAFTVLLAVAEANWPDLPRVLQDAVVVLAHGRLYPDPHQGFFQPFQIWSHPFLHGSIWQALVAAAAAWVGIGAFERRFGAFQVAVLVLIMAPLATSLPLIVGTTVGDPGLTAIALAGAAVCLATDPATRVRLRCWYVLPWQVGRFDGSAALGGLAACLAAVDLLLHALLSPVGSGILVVHAVAMGLTAGAGYLLAPGLWRPPPVPRRIDGLADGSLSLDQVESTLFDDDDIPLDLLRPLADRCIAAGRRDAAAALLRYLTLRDPESPIRPSLEAFLSLRDSPEDQTSGP